MIAAPLIAVAALAFPETSADAFLRDYYGRLPYADFEIVSRAVRTLEANSNGKSSENCYTKFPLPWKPLRGIMPSPANFVGVWNWDSAFHAIGVSHWDGDYARDQLKLFWEKLQLDNGMYADCLREGEDGIARLSIGGKPAPGFRLVTDCTKPPVFGWAAWRVNREHPDPAFLATAYDSLVRNVAWWRANRFDAEAGLFHYDGNPADPKDRKTAAGWESGMDDSPRWDGNAWNFHAIDLNAYLVLTYRALASFAAELGKPAEVRDWTAAADDLASAINTRLWDAQDGCYYDWDFRQKRFSRILTPASFTPLFAGFASAEQAASLARHAERLSPGWPSVAYDDPHYDPKGYWRGRTWLNVAYMALKGLKFYGFGEIAERGRREILGWVANDPGVIYETYDSATGLPCGASHFGWSSVFLLAFELDWKLPREAELPTAAAAVKPIYAMAGPVTDRTPGWTFQPSQAKGGDSFNPLEGYYPDKGGKLVSARLPLGPRTSGYYLLSFSARTPERCFEAINFYAANGRFLADNYDSIPPGGKRTFHRAFYAPPEATEIEVFFQSAHGCEAWDVRVEPCSALAAAEYCDRVAAELPPLTTPTPGAARLPRLQAALRDGTPLRVLLLGDSIVQDTYHSQFHALLKRQFPRSRIDWLVSVRGGTGCWFYREPANFKAYVSDLEPDVVLIGGISNWSRKKEGFAGNPEIEEVARRCAAAGYEVGVMSPALAFDRRLGEDAVEGSPVAPRVPAAEELTYNAEEFGPADLEDLAARCAANGWGYVDLTTPCYTWLYTSGLPWRHTNRDACHSSGLGKQIIARALVAGLVDR